VALLLPGAVTDDIAVGAFEASSGYADPSGTAAGFLAAARDKGARLMQGCRVTSVSVEHGAVVGVQTDRGRFASPVVVDVAGAWAADLARTVGLDVPVDTWRHPTAYFGLPDEHHADFPIVIDQINQVYFRPEGHGMMLVGLESGNQVGGSPDRPLEGLRPEALEAMVSRVWTRMPWMAGGTLRTAHGGQDGITPDQRAILCPAGPQGFFLACGFSGTGFKIAPAVGACLAELILDGRATTVDISGYSLDRFADGRFLVGEHPYGKHWQ
jgi:sarcosine oxidase subunit beta